MLPSISTSRRQTSTSKKKSKVMSFALCVHRKSQKIKCYKRGGCTVLFFFIYLRIISKKMWVAACIPGTKTCMCQRTHTNMSTLVLARQPYDDRLIMPVGHIKSCSTSFLPALDSGCLHRDRPVLGDYPLYTRVRVHSYAPFSYLRSYVLASNDARTISERLPRLWTPPMPPGPSLPTLPRNIPPPPLAGVGAAGAAFPDAPHSSR